MKSGPANTTAALLLRGVAFFLEKLSLAIVFQAYCHASGLFECLVIFV